MLYLNNFQEPTAIMLRLTNHVKFHYELKTANKNNYELSKEFELRYTELSMKQLMELY